MRRLGSLSATLAAIVLLVASAPADAGSPKPKHARLEIATLSTGPDRASGGDVLVRIDVPAGVALADVRVALNGADVTGALVPDGASHALVGLLTGLRDGDNLLTAAARGTKPSRNARLAIRNFPIYGPVFSGPHQVPWICETDTSGLGPALDEHCTVTPRFDWFYRASNNTFKPLLDPAVRPADLVQTTTIDGDVVDYIVRVESGTINQSIYRIAILDNPAAPIANPWVPGGRKPGPGWNGKLTFPFGGGCGAGFRSGRNAVTSALQHDPLSLGFAVAFGTRNTLGTGCDDVLSAETLMMIKERFIEQYGLPRFTIGSGGSGGSIQQHLIGQNYPGLLDALTPSASYPDVVSLADVIDCGPLYNYFTTIANPADWPVEKRAKVTGYPVSADGRENCGTWAISFANLLNPLRNFDPVVPLELRYDPVTNPTGARGSVYDQQVNIYGIDRHTGFARRPWDNVGVQYGLRALNDGDITKEEFLDLNEKVGGFDQDGQFVPERTAGNRKGVGIAYRTGRVNAGENLTLPMIDARSYTDLIADIHTRERTFAMAERLTKTNGTAANQVVWIRPIAGAGLPNLARMALLAHNEWLENILADPSDDPYPAKVIRNKPAWVTDTCWDAAGVKYEEPATPDGPGVCNTLFPVHANVRIVAGGPLAGDVLKCRLKPIDVKDYAVTFTKEEKKRLKATFPHGVCDYSKRGVKERRLHGTWLDFSP